MVAPGIRNLAADVVSRMAPPLVFDMTPITDRFWPSLYAEASVCCERCRKRGLRVPLGWLGRDADGEMRLAPAVRRRGQYSGASRGYFSAGGGTSRDPVIMECPRAGCGRQVTRKALHIADRAATGERVIFL